MLSADHAIDLTRQSIQSAKLNEADERRVFIKTHQEEYDKVLKLLSAEVERYVVYAAKQGKYSTQYAATPLNYRGKQDMEHVRANRLTRYALDEITNNLRLHGYQLDFEHGAEPLPYKLGIQWSRRQHVEIPLESLITSPTTGWF